MNYETMSVEELLSEYVRIDCEIGFNAFGGSASVADKFREEKPLIETALRNNLEAIGAMKERKRIKKESTFDGKHFIVPELVLELSAEEYPTLEEYLGNTKESVK